MEQDVIRAKIRDIVAEAARLGIPAADTLHDIVFGAHDAAVEFGLYKEFDGLARDMPLEIAGKLMSGELFYFVLRSGAPIQTAGKSMRDAHNDKGSG